MIEDIQEATAEALQNGEEGMVLKKKSYPYAPDKRPAWSTIKIKKMDYVDVICMGFCDATKKYTGKETPIWKYWETPEGLKEGEYFLWSCKYPGYYIPITKGYYYGWKTAVRIGAFDKNGKLIEIGTVASGLTDELREDFSKNPEKYLNRVVSIQCMEKNSKDHTLRHGFFKGFRDDKNLEDCTLDTIF